MAKELDNTYLRVDPITGRKVGEACFNGQHINGVDSLCRAVACKCACHDAKPRREKTEPATTTALPFGAGGIPIR